MSRPQEQYLLALTLEALTPPSLREYGSWERIEDKINPPYYLFGMYAYMSISEEALLDDEHATDEIRAVMLEYADVLDTHATNIYNWAGADDFGEESLEEEA